MVGDGDAVDNCHQNAAPLTPYTYTKYKQNYYRRQMYIYIVFLHLCYFFTNWEIPMFVSINKYI